MTMSRRLGTYRHEEPARHTPPPVDAKYPARSPYQEPLVGYLASRGLDPGLAARNGWYVSRSAGDKEVRVVIPCTNTEGYAYWQARAVDSHADVRYQSPRYSSMDSLVQVFPGAPSTVVAVVEGPMCALAAAEVGLVGIALMGNRPTKAVVDRVSGLCRYRRVVLIPDADALWAWGEIAAKFAQRGVYAPVVPIPGKDLASLAVDDRRRALHDYLEDQNSGVGATRGVSVG